VGVIHRDGEEEGAFAGTTCLCICVCLHGVREQVAGEWGVPKPPVITLIHGTRVTVRIAGITPAPALLVVEGMEVQQEHGPVTFAPCTATEVELTLAMPSQRLRLRWMSGGMGGPWSDWVSEHIALTSCMCALRGHYATRLWGQTRRCLCLSSHVAAMTPRGFTLA
jgi:hypothetical protein